MKRLTAKDYKVLTYISKDKNKGRSKVTALKKSEIMELTNLSYSKVRSAIILLEGYGFVDYGIAIGKADTVYVTEKGIEEMDNIRNQAKKEKESAK